MILTHASMPGNWLTLCGLSLSCCRSHSASLPLLLSFSLSLSLSLFLSRGLFPWPCTLVNDFCLPVGVLHNLFSALPSVEKLMNMHFKRKKNNCPDACIGYSIRPYVSVCGIVSLCQNGLYSVCALPESITTQGHRDTADVLFSGQCVLSVVCLALPGGLCRRSCPALCVRSSPDICRRGRPEKATRGADFLASSVTNENA